MIFHKPLKSAIIIDVQISVIIRDDIKYWTFSLSDIDVVIIISLLFYRFNNYEGQTSSPVHQKKLPESNLCGNITV